jgi:hypothetical protein
MSILKLVLITAFLTLGFNGCSGSNPQPKTPPVADLKGKKVFMQSKIPFRDGAFIKQSIKSECSLQNELANSIKAYAHNYNINMIFDDNSSKDGYSLKLEIVDAISQGSGFGAMIGQGHRKMTKVEGSLYLKDKKLATFFRGMRVSHGGYFGRFKSSCAVLAGTAKVLGKDIARWLNEPRDGSALGDLR